NACIASTASVAGNALLQHDDIGLRFKLLDKMRSPQTGKAGSHYHDIGPAVRSKGRIRRSFFARGKPEAALLDRAHGPEFTMIVLSFFTFYINRWDRRVMISYWGARQ